MTQIKICGVTRVEDAQLCEALDVEFVGLNFVPASKRCISIDTARTLMREFKNTKPVGIFLGDQSDQILKIAQTLKLPYVQIYDADEKILADLRNNGVRVVRAIRKVPTITMLESMIATGDLILLDGPRNGIAADRQAIKAFPHPIRNSIFLAGGLNPSNVAEAIDAIQPLAVDVASGIESAPGVKDHDLVRKFINTVRESSLSSS